MTSTPPTAPATTSNAALYLRYQDDPRNGVVFYQGGNNVNGRVAQERLILNSLITLPVATVPVDTPAPTEVSRSSPIVATVGGTEYQYQGTYEVNDPALPVTTYGSAADDSSFEFPYIKGHLRAIPSSALGSSETDFNNLSAAFDVGADGNIPTPTDSGCSTNFAGTCRTVFTTIETPSTTAGLVQQPDRVFLDTDNVAQLKPLMGSSLTDTEGETLISRVLAGVSDGSGGYKPELGGVDRSTMAIIEPSPLIASSADRPTMIYFGATDGMLHAVCAEAKGACPAAGRELWAFIPRTQLPYLRLNTSRIDGSPKVADVFDDFDPTDGVVKREWRTILTFQTGSGNAGDPNSAPAVVALDITDPSDPTVLWERTTPSSRGTIDLGIGLNLAMGPARLSGSIVNLTLAETNNGGTSGTAGFYLAGIDTATGDMRWEVKQAYNDPRDSADPPVPTTGIPGGAVAVDLDNSSLITHVLVPSLYGELWEYTADGQNPFGTSPLFRFSGDYHPIGAPPTVYFDQSTGRTFAAIASGGYADPVGSSWAPDGVDQFVVSVAIDANAGNVPIDESGNGFGSDRAFVQNIGVNRAYAQAVVAGNELFITTDSSDVNDAAFGMAGATGSLYRFSLTNGDMKGSVIAVSGGASSTDVTSSGVVHVGSGSGAEVVDVSQTGGGGAFDSQGTVIEHDATDSVTRLLWISS